MNPKDAARRACCEMTLYQTVDPGELEYRKRTAVARLGDRERLISRALDLLAVLRVGGRDEVLVHLLPGAFGSL